MRRSRSRSGRWSGGAIPDGSPAATANKTLHTIICGTARRRAVLLLQAFAPRDAIMVKHGALERTHVYRMLGSKDARVRRAAFTLRELSNPTLRRDSQLVIEIMRFIWDAKPSYDVYREFSQRHLYVPYKVHELIAGRLKAEKRRQQSAVALPHGEGPQPVGFFQRLFRRRDSARAGRCLSRSDGPPAGAAYPARDLPPCLARRAAAPRSAAGANVGVDLQQRTHRRFGAGARHAAFGGDAERRRVAARRRCARVLVMQEDRKLLSNGLALRPHRLLKEMILHVLGQIAPDPNY